MSSFSLTLSLSFRPSHTYRTADPVHITLTGSDALLLLLLLLLSSDDLHVKSIMMIYDVSSNPSGTSLDEKQI